MTDKPEIPAKHSAKRGAAILPAVITAAVAVTLIQVPLLYKSKSGPRFPGNHKSSLSAQSLAEAGIEEAVTDIGRRTIRINADIDTMPYANVGLGRGSYSTRVKADPLRPGVLEVLSTGHVGGAAQSIRARMALIKSPATIPYETPGRSAWGIRGTPPALYYQSLDEQAANQPWIHPEGEVILPGDGQGRIEDLAMAPNGTLYFILNAPGSVSTLYKIRPSDLDDNPATPVTARLVGPTGLASGADGEIRGLTFLSRDHDGHDGILYALTSNTRKLYELSLDNGAASPVANLCPKGLPAGADFHCDALAQGADGSLYLMRNDAKSQLWRFDNFTDAAGKRQDTLSLAAEIPTAGMPIRAMAAHPDGNLYATDGLKWYRISPSHPNGDGRVTEIFPDPSDLYGIAFHYERENHELTGGVSGSKVDLCHYPAGNCLNMNTIQIDAANLAAHTRAHASGSCPAEAPGRCLGSLAAFGAADTTIQLKIMSWEEVPGDLASIR